jgi:hypothetical protein
MEHRYEPSSTHFGTFHRVDRLSPGMPDLRNLFSAPESALWLAVHRDSICSNGTRSRPAVVTRKNLNRMKTTQSTILLIFGFVLTFASTLASETPSIPNCCPPIQQEDDDDKP